MCGIVGAIAERDVGKILLEGLKKLEYRGYDSAGIAMINEQNQLQRARALGRVQQLVNLFENQPIMGNVGIAHTRWATHGAPSERNAHPHQSGENIALIHNGIIENYQVLRKQLMEEGYEFASDTDTETIAHLLHQQLKIHKDFLKAVKQMVQQLHGAFALAIVNAEEPDRFIAVRYGSPLVVGLGIGENFVASDVLALLPVTQQFIFLEDGDIADIRRETVTIHDHSGKIVQRKIHISELNPNVISRGDFRHFMLKEIFDQPEALQATLTFGLSYDDISQEAFGSGATQIFEKVKRIQIVACGTSYHAAMVARYWMEEIARIPCRVEIASEFRYRKVMVEPDTLFITISQSGETADTLAALRKAKTMGYVSTLTIGNVPESSLVRESDLSFVTHAGVEVGVASTKTFTTQLLALLMLTIIFAKRHLNEKERIRLINLLKVLPQKIEETLKLAKPVKQLADVFADKQHTLFLGRGMLFPIAAEGALKLKEISYIHAEAYAAGELKHGPLALVDREMPVVVVAPSDELLAKLKSNLEEVRARGGRLIVFADNDSDIKNTHDIISFEMPQVDRIIAPIVYVVPLQLLSYFVALIKGTDVDHPRNLAKSVTVE